MATWTGLTENSATWTGATENAATWTGVDEATGAASAGQAMGVLCLTYAGGETITGETTWTFVTEN